MAETDTKERLLDASEHLFAERGYHKTSLREITRLAEANLAAVNYHFGSKKKLMEAVIKRRISVIDKERLATLDSLMEAAKAEGRIPKAGDILRSFIQPIFDSFVSEEGYSDFLVIISRCHIDPDDTVRQIFFEIVRPTFHRFFQALCEALPQLPEERVYYRFMFALGSMVQSVIEGGKLEFFSHMPGRKPVDHDFSVFTEELIAFGIRGMGGEE